MKRALFAGACALVSSSSAIPAFQIQQVGLFCNSQEAAAWLAKIQKEKGRERLKWAFHVQSGRTHLNTDPGQWVVADPLWCQLKELIETTGLISTDLGNVVKFTPSQTTLMPIIVSYGRWNTLQEELFLVKGTEWLYVTEMSRMIPLLNARQ